jgi:hypothetical protein
MNLKVLAQAALCNFAFMFGAVCVAFYFLAAPAIHLLGLFLGALSAFGQ